MARYAIRVLFPDGGIAFVRHGPVIGHGPIVRFPNKRAAEADLALIQAGLDDGVVARVMRIADSPKKVDA